MDSNMISDLNMFADDTAIVAAGPMSGRWWAWSAGYLGRGGDDRAVMGRGGDDVIPVQ